VTPGRSLHRTRAALVASTLLVLTLAGHSAGNGAVTLAGLLAATVLSTALAVATTRRPLSWRRAITVLLGGEALLHLVLTFTSGHGHTSTAIDGTTMVVAHVLASLVAAAVLVRAEGIAAAWSAYLRATVGASLPVPGAPHAPAHSPRHVSACARRTLAGIRHVLVLRGPPRGSACTC